MEELKKLKGEKISLDGINHGDEVLFECFGLHRGKICIQVDDYYFCSNHEILDGADCDDKLGYKYSWVLGSKGLYSIKGDNDEEKEESKTIKYEDFKHGQRVTCEIEGEKIKDARISICKSRGYKGGPENIFICQDRKNGEDATDLLGYEYSWIICRCNRFVGSFEMQVKNLKIVEEPNEEQVEDEEEEGDKNIEAMKGEEITKFEDMEDGMKVLYSDSKYGSRELAIGRIAKRGRSLLYFLSNCPEFQEGDSLFSDKGGYEYGHYIGGLSKSGALADYQKMYRVNEELEDETIDLCTAIDSRVPGHYCSNGKGLVPPLLCQGAGYTSTSGNAIREEVSDTWDKIFDKEDKPKRRINVQLFD